MPLEDTRATGGRTSGTPGWVVRAGGPSHGGHDDAHSAAAPLPAAPSPTAPSPTAPTPPPPPPEREPEPAPVLEAVPISAPEPEPAVEAAPGRRRSRVVPVLATTLALVLIAGGALVAYLWRATDEWRASSAGWESLAATAAADLERTRGDLTAAQQVLDDTREQLSTAQERITELANEKAQLGDDSAAQQQLVDYQARVSEAAGKVATALATCIAGQQQLITYMDSADAHEPGALRRFRDDVDALCGQATEANEQLQHELEP
ncbi:hypothetical protein [Cellulomonas palmilytica]|uniref:hypothetical protein n=1 Tax=Cellulomonas palmilytica TaxID=2608402 RepID=UPI001F2C308F|nr:hypothetical protein [Cellulomonas palmilytica]